MGRPLPLRRRLHRLAPTALASALLSLSTAASAQPPGPASDPAIPAPAPSPDAVTLPLRLSLLDPGARGCGQPSVDDAGTILPVQPHVEVQLTLRLTLEMVANLGCPGDPYRAFDAGAGAGLTYAAPLRPGLVLVASLGAYQQPFVGRTAAAGVDLLWSAVDARGSATTKSLGIGVKAPPGRGVQVTGRVGGSF